MTARSAISSPKQEMKGAMNTKEGEETQETHPLLVGRATILCLIQGSSSEGECAFFTVAPRGVWGSAGVCFVRC